MQTVGWCVELAIACLGITGLALNSRILTDGFRKDMLAYYTNLSNALVTLFYLARCICRAAGASEGWLYRALFCPFLHYAMAVMITVTFIIYHFILLPAVKKDPASFGWFGNYKRFSNLCVHYIVPLATLVNWLIWGGKAGLGWYAPLLWVIFPLIYEGCVLLRGSTGKNLTDTQSPYPYAFLDPIAIGWAGLAKTSVVMLLALILLGYVILGLGLLAGMLI